MAISLVAAGAFAGLSCLELLLVAGAGRQVAPLLGAAQGDLLLGGPVAGLAGLPGPTAALGLVAFHLLAAHVHPSLQWWVGDQIRASSPSMARLTASGCSRLTRWPASATVTSSTSGIWTTMASAVSLGTSSSAAPRTTRVGTSILSRSGPKSGRLVNASSPPIQPAGGLAPISCLASFTASARRDV